MSSADDLHAALDAHAAGAWPATVARRTADGWLLRATPGLDRGRSNHALPPWRPLAAAEIPGALATVIAFATEHGIATGIQVGPPAVHGALDAALDAAGWTSRWPTAVLTCEAADVAHDDPLLVVDDHASAAWLSAWARAEGRADVQAHADTVFAALAGRAMFGRLGDDTAGIGVPGGGLTGLFCLAVTQARRREGLATRLVRALTARGRQPRVYLQVEESNAGALALYARLGFQRAYSYRHRTDGQS